MSTPFPSPPAAHSAPLSVTVVLCTRNRPAELGRCLESLSRLRYPGLQVLVVENGPADGETRPVAERSGARYLHSPRMGLSRARNDGARACQTDLVAFTDDDGLPDAGWLEALAAEFADPRVMAVGGEVYPPTSDASANALPNSPPAQRGRRRVVDLETPEWFSLVNFGGIGDGGNMCFRRAAFDLWPGFDQRLGRGAPLDSAEEHLAFFQLVLAGYRSVHTPRALVWHRFPQSAEEWRRYNLKNLTNAVAYCALLWWEYPQCRRLLLRHLWRRGARVRERSPASHPGAALSRIDKLRIIAGGLWLFGRLPRASRESKPRGGSPSR